MNKDEASGNRKQLKGKMKEKWGKLTDDDMQVVNAISWSVKSRSVMAMRKMKQSAQ